MKDAKDVALEYFAAGYNCAEAVLLAVAQAQGIESPLLPGIASGFGGGIGRCGEVCGSLSGAVMALGLKYGRSDPKDGRAKDFLYARSEEIIQDFEEEFGNIQCLSLTGCNLRTPQGQAMAKAMDLQNSFCPKFVAFATERVMQMIEDEPERES